MAFAMDITFISDQTFRIKGRTGVITTDPKGPTIESSSGEKITFTGPGEYEVYGISIIGISTDDGTAFVYEIDKLRICHLGKLKKKLPENKLSLLGNIDVLLVSVGPETIEMVQQVEGFYVIPFGYEDQETLDKFLKESGLTVEKMSKFSLKKEEIIEDTSAQIVVLGKD